MKRPLLACPLIPGLIIVLSRAVSSQPEEDTIEKIRKRGYLLCS